MANPACTSSKASLLSKILVPWTFFTDTSPLDITCNASSGAISQAQVDNLAAKGKADAIQAAGATGKNPDVQNAIGKQVYDDIQRVLGTFALPGETGEDVGALPQQSGFRIPGTGNITINKLNQIIPKLPDLTNLKWYVLGAGLIVGAFFAFPYIAPALGANINAAKSLRK